VPGLQYNSYLHLSITLSLHTYSYLHLSITMSLHTDSHLHLIDLGRRTTIAETMPGVLLQLVDLLLPQLLAALERFLLLRTPLRPCRVASVALCQTARNPADV
jgi:hypothetical protein